MGIKCYKLLTILILNSQPALEVESHVRGALDIKWRVDWLPEDNKVGEWVSRIWRCCILAPCPCCDLPPCPRMPSSKLHGAASKPVDVALLSLAKSAKIWHKILAQNCCRLTTARAFCCALTHFKYITRCRTAAGGKGCSNKQSPC